ncbi:hypothetical protein STEG23_030632, partial [Scotinomys teguina]
MGCSPAWSRSLEKTETNPDAAVANHQSSKDPNTKFAKAVNRKKLRNVGFEFKEADNKRLVVSSVDQIDLVQAAVLFVRKERLTCASQPLRSHSDIPFKEVQIPKYSKSYFCALVQVLIVVISIFYQK